MIPVSITSDIYNTLFSFSSEKNLQERLGDAAALLTTGRKWLSGRRTLADARKDEVMEQGRRGAKSTGANTAHVHGADKTVEVTVVGLGGESAARRSVGKSGKSAGLVPFCADYRTPRTHPPRNN